MKIAEFASSVDLDVVAHYEPPHQDLHCLQILIKSKQYNIENSKTMANLHCLP